MIEPTEEQVERVKQENAEEYLHELEDKEGL